MARMIFTGKANRSRVTRQILVMEDVLFAYKHGRKTPAETSGALERFGNSALRLLRDLAKQIDDRTVSADSIQDQFDELRMKYEEASRRIQLLEDRVELAKRQASRPTPMN